MLFVVAFRRAGSLPRTTPTSCRRPSRSCSERRRLNCRRHTAVRPTEALQQRCCRENSSSRSRTFAKQVSTKTPSSHTRGATVMACSPSCRSVRPCLKDGRSCDASRLLLFFSFFSHEKCGSFVATATTRCRKPHIVARSVYFTPHIFIYKEIHRVEMIALCVTLQFSYSILYNHVQSCTLHSVLQSHMIMCVLCLVVESHLR